MAGRIDEVQLTTAEQIGAVPRWQHPKSWETSVVEDEAEEKTLFEKPDQI